MRVEDRARVAVADLTALEAWAKPILIHGVWFDVGDPASTKQFVAAIERFHTTYPENWQRTPTPRLRFHSLRSIPFVASQHHRRSTTTTA